MAERSKAPDSRYSLLADSKSVREFWSSYEGVGSNPTSDKITFSIILSMIYLFSQFTKNDKYY